MIEGGGGMRKTGAKILRLENHQLTKTRAGKAALKVHAAETAEKIAKRVKNPEMLRKALLTKLRAQRDFAAEYRGKFPGAGRPDGGNYASSGAISSEGWCLSYGFALRTVQRWLDLLVAAGFSKKETEIFRRFWMLAEMEQAANYSSESNEWYTPAKYLDAVHEVLGSVDLDPASNAQANQTVRAAKIFTKDDDGLARTWHGRVFVNPPYGRADDGGSLAAAFCNKAIGEYECGNVQACIILVNSSHSQTWQAPLYEHTICFVNHRIQFVSADGEENENPTFQNIFVYLGNEPDKFAVIFSRFGYVMHKVMW
jgi:hypothetical protein